MLSTQRAGHTRWFFIIWRNYTDRMSPYGIPFTHNAFPSWRQSVRGHIACLQGALFRTEKKTPVTCSARGVGAGASSRGGLFSLKRNMPYALVELGPAQAPLKVIRKSCTPSSQCKKQTVQKQTSRQLCHGLQLAGNCFLIVLHS